MTSTYSNRYHDTWIIESVDDGAVHSTGGWATGATAEARAALRPGDTIVVETAGSSLGRVCGMQRDGVWIYRLSDEYLAEERQRQIEDGARRDRERLTEHRAEYIGREEMLPGWLKERIHVFHERGGEKFELEGWGYELVICELAALYAESDCDDSPAVLAFADEQGTSGNQHDCAKMLARRHAAGASLAGTVAGISPITGDAFYEGAARA